MSITIVIIIPVIIRIIRITNKCNKYRIINSAIRSSNKTNPKTKESNNIPYNIKAMLAK
jgi:hypothetical protein